MRHGLTSLAWGALGMALLLVGYALAQDHLLLNAIRRDRDAQVLQAAQQIQQFKAQQAAPK